MDHKRVIDELTQGKEFAKQLQIHLDNPSSSHELQEILIHNILNSYDKSLSLLTARGLNANGGESHLHAGMGITRLESQVSFSESPRSQDSNSEFKDPDHKDFGAKRKSNGSMEKWKNQVKVRADMGFEKALDDGHSWRKYGQKDILGAKHPRGYYRCTYRQLEGCLATKQVQRTDEDPNIFNMTYWGSHTCNPGIHTASILPLPSPSPPRPEIQHPPQQNQLLQSPVDEDPNIFNMTYQGSHNCNPRTHTTSTLPLRSPSPPQQEIQHPPQQNQLLQSPEILLTFQTGCKVVTENLETPSFHFPSTSNNNFIFPRLDNTLDVNISSSFISPATSRSTYFTMSQPRVSAVGKNPSAVVAESELNDVVSAATSSTSSHNVDVGFPFGELEFGNNFNFDNSIFFD